MTVIPLLATLAVVPGMSFLQPIEFLVGEGILVVDTVPGEGISLAAGESVTLNFSLRDGLGRLLADSQVRGLPFTCRYGADDLDPLLKIALEGVKPSTQRLVFFSSDRFSEGIGSLVPPRSDLVLSLRVLP